MPKIKAKKKLSINNREVRYELRESKRARRMRLTIYCDGSLVVTVPRKFSMDLLEKFILDKYSWIIQKINYFKIRRDRTSNENLIASSKKEYQKHKKTANELVLSRIRHWIRLEMRFPASSPILDHVPS